MPIIHSIIPTASMERGEVRIAVTGKGFINLPTLACRFGLANDSGPAQFVSSNHIECLTPVESEPGMVSLEVTLNGLDYTAQEIGYRFLPMASISQLTPKAGLVGGGTPVAIEGLGFAAIQRQGVRVTCQWDMPGLDPREVLVTQAAVASDSRLTCVSPPAAQPGSASVSVLADTVNIVDEDNVELFFEYELHATVIKLVPTHGPPSGGTRITIAGDGFKDGNNLSCRFHSVPGCGSPAVEGVVRAVDVHAEFMSTTEVRCLSPALAAYDHRQENASDVCYSLVEVSNHAWSLGAFDTNRGLSFWYRPQPKVSVAN